MGLVNRFGPRSAPHIAVVADTFFGYGGAEILAREWAVRTRASGCPVSVLCGDADCSAHDSRSGLFHGVFPVGKSRLAKVNRALGEFRKTRKLVNALQDHGPFDLIHSHRLLPNADVITLGFPLEWVEEVMPGERKKPVHHLHKAMEKEAVRTAKYLIATSPLAHGLWLQRYPEEERKFVLIRPGVETQAGKPGERGQARSELGRELGLDPDLVTLLFIGNDGKRKRLPECLKAIALLPFPVNLIVAGHAGEDGKLRVRENRRLRLVGTIRSGIERFYAGSDCLLLPSKLENFGMVVTEALSVGTPVITSSRTGAKEAVEETGMGKVLEEPVIPEAIAIAIAERFPEGKPVQLRPKPLDPKYDWKASVDRLLAVYASAGVETQAGGP